MFINSLKLAKFMIRQERVNSTVWILSMVLFNFAILLLMGLLLMPEAADRLEFMAMLENPALLAMVGPLYSMDVTTMGALYTMMMFVFVAIAVGIMNIFLIVRHTRADEEAGRYEVLRSLPCGRLANVNAAMLTALIVNTVMAVLFAITMWIGMAMVNDPMGFGAALLWGITLGIVGLAFAAVAALFSQLSSNSRGASGYSFFVLGLFYFLRAGADMDRDRMDFLAYFSPLGLASRTWVYVNNIWWPILIILGMAAIFTALAYWMCSIRDIDQGLIPARPGSATGGWLLKSPLGLNVRLMRASIIVWVIVLFVVGFSYSTVLEDIDSFVAGNEMYRQMLLAPTGLLDQIDIDQMSTADIAAQMNAVLNMAGFNIVQMFANMIGFMMAFMSLVPVLLFVLKARAEERAIRAEIIFATPASRTRYLLGFVIISFVSAALMQVAHAVGLYTIVPSVLANPADLPLSFLLQSALLYVPALWVMSGLAVLLIGLFPKKAGWIWAYYGFSLFAMMYGRMIPEIDWVANLTPFGWVPQLPVDDISWPVIVVMSVIGIGFAAAGMFFYSKRDINAITH